MDTKRGRVSCGSPAFLLRLARALANGGGADRGAGAAPLHLQDAVSEDVYDLRLAPVRDPLALRPVQVDVPVQP